jgi:hypothetical protein
MAQHIDSIRTSGIPQVSKADFYTSLVWGDLIFAQGNYAISKGIEQITKSPLSHVLMVWLPFPSSEWLTLESTSDKGVHIGRVTDYVDKYNGDLVLCRRKLTDEQKYKALKFGFALLDDKYDARQEAKIVAHKLCSLYPVSASKNEFFCSSLMQQLGIYQLAPFKTASIPGEMDTPEDIFTDPSVETVCSLVKS